MNARERILALAAVTVVILAGGGFLFKFLFLDAMAALDGQIVAAQQDRQKKQADLAREKEEEQTVLLGDPRLKEWTKLSLPEDPNEKEEIKSGRTPEDT